MAGEDRLRELEEKYEDYKVYDNRGDRIGKVDDLFVDETDREEYIGVKLGLFGMKSTLIPMDIVRVNEADRTIEVSDTKDNVKNAPSFDDDEDITGEYERRIRDHFGLEAVESSSSRGGYGGSSDRTEAATGEVGGAAGAAGDREHDASSHHEHRESGTDAEYEGRSRDRDSQHSTTAGEHSTAEAEHTDAGHADADAGHTHERAGSAPEGGSQSVPEYGGPGEASGTGETGQTPEGEHRGSEASAGSGDSSGSAEAPEGTATGVPTSRQTEETETFQAGGRTKVRRRIVREEVVDADDDPNAR